jgi:acyl carrier protein phosphodiesterase
MLRWIGAALVLGGAFMMAYLSCAEMKRQVEEARAYLDFLRYIRAQIDCFCAPRHVMFASYRNPLLEKSGFLTALRDGAGMREALTSCGNRSRELGELMGSFDAELGKSYREEQLAACDFYTERLGGMLEGWEQALPARMKVRRTVCIAGALMLVLLLI